MRNIIFDFYEVFAYGLYGHGAMGKIAEERLGLTKEEYLHQNGGMWARLQDLMRGAIREVEYWREVIQNAGWSVGVAEAIEASRVAAATEIPGMSDLVRRINREEHRIYLLSDTWREMARDTEGMYPWLINGSVFTKLYYSYEYERLKSDPGTFEFVLWDAGLDPAETLFIDDYDVNVARAEAAGITGIVFKDAEDLKQQFLKYDIHLR